MNTPHLDASIIVVSYNKLPYTRLFLESLLRSDPLPAQVIVVDNGSDRATQEWLLGFAGVARTHGLDYSLVVNETNRGACTARNQALELARGQYLAFADNDLAVRSRDWLATLAARLERTPETGIAGPKLVFPWEPYAIECAGVAISPGGRVQYRGRGDPRASWAEAGPVPCLISACWLMKRAVYEEIGGLDEIFNPAQYEDFDFCYRAREAGWEVWYEPAAEMYHFENVTTAGSPGLNFKYVTIRNGLEFKRRWQRLFGEEGGPADEECQWRDLETRGLEDVPPPPVV
jgi:O-antigen biosynthesis protein